MRDLLIFAKSPSGDRFIVPPNLQPMSYPMPRRSLKTSKSLATIANGYFALKIVS